MTATDLRPGALQLAIERDATNPPGKSELHGESHWKAVALTGFWLARRLDPLRIDMEFIFTFSLLHDVMRQDDGEDPQHGWRASHLFVGLCVHPGLEGFPPYDQRSQDMAYALSNHVGTTHARRHENLNVGICWDADRLNLWRVGIEPSDLYLTTEVARTTGAKLLGLGFCQKQLKGEPFPTWAAIRREIELWRH